MAFIWHALAWDKCDFHLVCIHHLKVSLSQIHCVEGSLHPQSQQQ